VEDGTASASFPNQVPEELAHERLQRVADLQERLADEAARRFVGRTLDVVVQERGGPDGPTLARSYREAPDTDGEIEVVTAEGAPAPLPVGEVATVEVLDAVGVDLVARPVAPEPR
jgi:ribosomal protein S12 methylthiotransferase